MLTKCDAMMMLTKVRSPDFLGNCKGCGNTIPRAPEIVWDGVDMYGSEGDKLQTAETRVLLLT